jgi:hypothetical protein
MLHWMNLQAWLQNGATKGLNYALGANILMFGSPNPMIQNYKKT